MVALRVRERKAPSKTGRLCASCLEAGLGAGMSRRCGLGGGVWWASLLTQRLDGGGQAALVAGSLVLVDDFFVGDAIQRAGGLLEDLGSDGLVASIDGLAHALDRRTQHGTQAGVVFVAFHRLAGALASLGRVGH